MNKDGLIYFWGMRNCIEIKYTSKYCNKMMENLSAFSEKYNNLSVDIKNKNEKNHNYLINKKQEIIYNIYLSKELNHLSYSLMESVGFFKTLHN
jgi:chromosome segregation and condensation protein ScpB